MKTNFILMQSVVVPSQGNGNRIIYSIQRKRIQSTCLQKDQISSHLLREHYSECKDVFQNKGNSHGTEVKMIPNFFCY